MPRKLGKILLGMAAMLLILRLCGLFAGRPAVCGVVDARLAPCPASPNCVCTQDSDPRHAIPPLVCSGPADEAMRRLVKIVEAQPRARIVKVDKTYLHAEFTSRMFGFVDDVEFLLDAGEQRIDFRSASRLGRSDLGVNRRRMEAIRQAWSQAPAPGR